ncbi:MAG TPA: DUF4339 domain-containing protein [Pirellulales bacterium]|jgi:hypothetical protein
MGIRFECVHCGHILHVKDFLAGKRGICPHCQGKIEIPHGSTIQAGPDEGGPVAVELRNVIDDQATREMGPGSFNSPHATAGMAGSREAMPNAITNAAPAYMPPNVASPQQPMGATGPAPGDSSGDAGLSQWYVLPPGSMTKYGPAQGDLIRSWVEEGRVAADALVWREGWPQWRPAASVFPQLAQAAPAVPSVPTTPAVRPHVVATTDSDVNTAMGPAVELSIDDPVTSTPQRSTKYGPKRAPSGKRMRQQQSLIIGLLVTLIVILLPLFIYVLLNQ